MNIDARLFRKTTVCGQCPQHVNDEVVKASVSGVLHLRDVLQLVIDSLDNGSLPEQQFVGNTHQRAFHVVPQFRDELYAVNEKPFKEFPADVSLVRDEFPVDELHESLVFEGFPVVHVTRRYHEVEQLAPLIADKVQLEPEEPAHGALAPLGDSLEDLVDVDPLVPAYTQRRAVDETDARTLAEQHLLDKQRQRNCHLVFQLDKAVVRDHAREQMAHVLTDGFHIEVLQAAVAGVVE